MSYDRTAYLAGFFDGEGCISIKLTSSNARRLEISANQVDRRPLDLLADRYGGSIRRRTVEAHRQPMWTWRLEGWSAVRALAEWLPFLTVKMEQAKLAVEFQRHLRKKGGPRLTWQEIAERDSYREAIRDLKVVAQ